MKIIKYNTMKQIYFLTCLLLFINIKGNSQTSDVLTGLSSPYALTLNENELFISDIQKGGISKIDITLALPIPLDIITNEGSIYDMEIKGNFLYFSNLRDGKISKTDITLTTPVVTDVLTGLNKPLGLAFKGNELFIAEWGARRILKILDITANTPVVVEVLINLNRPTKFAFKDNELYFTLDADGKVSKINDVTESSLTVTEVVKGLTNPVDIVFNGNDLYISEPKTNTITDKIHKTDISKITPTLTEVTTGISGPRGIIFKENVLYIAETYAAKISKLDISILSLNQFNKNNIDIKIYPNPSTKLLQVSGLIKKEQYKIYNILGEKVMEGIITENENINIRNLKNGVYLFRINKGNTLKFLKE